MEAFESPAGALLVEDMIAAQRAAKAKGARILTLPLAKLMREQIEAVLTVMREKVYRSGAVFRKVAHSQVTITVSQHEDLWAAAIEQVMKEHGHEVVATVKPAMQSVADDVLDKTTTLLTGKPPLPVIKHALTKDISEMAKQVTNVTETTRARLVKVIRKGIDDGLDPFKVMELVRDKIPQIATNRVPTIVRTEMGRAADRAAVASMRGSNVTHVSVVGCESIEPGSPTFNGVSTCNIKNVPIVYAGSLLFHPNHTGAIISSGFKQRNGQAPNLPVKPGGAIGTWEDRGRPNPSVVNEPSPGSGNPPKPPKPPKPKPPPPPAAPKPKPKPPAPKPITRLRPFCRPRPRLRPHCPARCPKPRLRRP
jgi:hypothetical protein